jgi:hypothetical protein
VWVSSAGARVTNGVRKGSAQLDRQRSREKGASLFTMIPLERWNVEREGHFCGKRTMNWMEQPIVRSPIRCVERKLRRRATDLWNVVKRSNPVESWLDPLEIRHLWNAGTWNARDTSAVKGQWVGWNSTSGTIEKCRKEAVTDGLKRAARQLGNATGGCLYNKQYLEKVKTVRGPADRIEFLEDELFRKPVNKRKWFVLAQERAQMVSRGGRRQDEYGGSDDDDMFAEIADSEEVFIV